ncbi:HIT family protein [Candidatus Roizmanbacteria bacterium CG_4_10_14_0_2_um_filter_36_35]|uniref:HIT family protein n=5 Tax=Candidatus Roizmaniibacteriota TaxID=1752723 RepID=A0A2M8F431_9BACT|nr:MAG: HIT family protein [Candidatus Roizmanbacteria bacterium CG23_combo_of_CG06-09_8_20_14_all_35_49]PIP63156.1 MAG: HIT family protein [Candidatus Roizmanbacteria bacterium CG22_combo_CG10-13_8_21_14_all_35_9]PIY71323.1 MAG: HIT family protein [Candidatus Roizmanbacteria bacterium CG_4_10_14_0_8_um_filter_35_28]PIZ68423.1 MAG: HIT family protein [Candidatus Roizmanbacteria bacterium CG_4_10_14_0_2_um_filter_36_35]PJC34064.1 MAG: HIT family protein [Candidatus Roizmanbacteria bacterium CG_4
MDNCIFCKIIQKQAFADIVYEDPNLIAIIPLEQASKGHTLLITKEHIENLFDIDEETLQIVAVGVKKLTKKLVYENKPTGINLLHASGKDAQQSVFHFHIHLVPRYKNDGLDLWIRNKL